MSGFFPSFRTQVSRCGDRAWAAYLPRQEVRCPAGASRRSRLSGGTGHCSQLFVTCSHPSRGLGKLLLTSTSFFQIYGSLARIRHPLPHSWLPSEVTIKPISVPGSSGVVRLRNITLSHEVRRRGTGSMAQPPVITKARHSRSAPYVGPLCPCVVFGL